MSEVKLTKFDLKRYDRQMIISGWGINGQRRLKSSKVVVMGAGGLGSPALIYLAAVGVGKLTIVDDERFELSNLNRQVLGWQRDIGRLKAEVAAEKLRELNPDLEVVADVAKITRENVRGLVRDANVVVDGMDNWSTRFIINWGCVREGVPFIHAGIYGFSGQITTIVPGKGPCLRCILPRMPEEIKRFPVVGATPALLASLQVMEVIKLILGIGEPLIGRMLIVDGLKMNFTEVAVKRKASCPVCSKRDEDVVV